MIQESELEEYRDRIWRADLEGLKALTREVRLRTQPLDASREELLTWVLRRRDQLLAGGDRAPGLTAEQVDTWERRLMKAAVDPIALEAAWRDFTSQYQKGDPGFREVGRVYGRWRQASSGDTVAPDA